MKTTHSCFACVDDPAVECCAATDCPMCDVASGVCFEDPSAPCSTDADCNALLTRGCNSGQCINLAEAIVISCDGCCCNMSGDPEFAKSHEDSWNDSLLERILMLFLLLGVIRFSRKQRADSVFPVLLVALLLPNFLACGNSNNPNLSTGNAVDDDRDALAPELCDNPFFENVTPSSWDRLGCSEGCVYEIVGWGYMNPLMNLMFESGQLIIPSETDGESNPKFCWYPGPDNEPSGYQPCEEMQSSVWIEQLRPVALANSERLVQRETARVQFWGRHPYLEDYSFLLDAVFFSEYPLPPESSPHEAERYNRFAGTLRLNYVRAGAIPPETLQEAWLPIEATRIE